MKKVTIEITPAGWKTTLVAEGRTYEQRWERCTGGVECLDSQFEESDIPEDMANALDEIDLHDVVYALDSFDDE